MICRSTSCTCGLGIPTPSHSYSPTAGPALSLEFEQVLSPLLADPPGYDSPPRSTSWCRPCPDTGSAANPTTTGWNIHRIAQAWCELTTRLGYSRFLAAGSDWGTSISTSIALQHPDRLLGLHLVPPLVPPDRDAPDLTAAERRALADLDERTRTGSGYSAMQATRPQTVGYGLSDSPAGLAAWLGEKLWSWTDQAAGGLSRNQMLDNLSLYWLTGTAASSARLYWESIAEVSRWFTTATGDTVTVPTGCSVFPKEVPRPSRRWAGRRFTNIVHWSEPDRGGHFLTDKPPALHTHSHVIPTTWLHAVGRQAGRNQVSLCCPLANPIRGLEVLPPRSIFNIVVAARDHDHILILPVSLLVR